jgi:hypothetical protein
MTMSIRVDADGCASCCLVFVAGNCLEDKKQKIIDTENDEVMIACQV